MLFMCVYRMTPDVRDETNERFMEAGGPPPPGVQMVGRWHAAGGNYGWTLAETDDAEALARWCHEWADLIDFEIVPVIDDDQVGRVISS